MRLTGCALIVTTPTSGGPGGGGAGFLWQATVAAASKTPTPSRKDRQAMSDCMGIKSGHPGRHKCENDRSLSLAPELFSSLVRVKGVRTKTLGPAEEQTLASLENPVSHRPSAPVRVAQILEAAEACFREHGFHAASMAQIAASARMSVGHIYRYFPGKDSIVVAIITRDLEAVLAEFDELDAAPGPILPIFYQHLRRAVARLSVREHAALRLEVMAEAARKPAMARLVRETRRVIEDRLTRVLRSASEGRWSVAEAAEKVDVLLTFIDSIATKRIAEPNYDEQATADRLARYAACILEQP